MHPKAEAFGTKAKQALADKVFGKEVRIEWTDRDKYKRIIGEVYLDDRRICLEMVQEGFAWHYVQLFQGRRACQGGDGSPRRQARIVGRREADSTSGVSPREDGHSRRDLHHGHRHEVSP